MVRHLSPMGPPSAPATASKIHPTMSFATVPAIALFACMYRGLLPVPRVAVGQVGSCMCFHNRVRVCVWNVASGPHRTLLCIFLVRRAAPHGYGCYSFGQCKRRDVQVAICASSGSMFQVADLARDLDAISSSTASHCGLNAVFAAFRASSPYLLAASVRIQPNKPNDDNAGARLP